MRTTPGSRLALALLPLAALSASGGTAPTAAGPSRRVASRYAHRTYVVQPGAGRRHFALAGPRRAVRAADGSTITAFGAVLADSGDGTGQIVLLFRGRRFLGWASAFDTVRLVVSTSGRRIFVTYGVFRGNDPFCCPSSRRTVAYRWVRGRIVADGTPPRIYGRRGDRLHLAR